MVGVDSSCDGFAVIVLVRREGYVITGDRGNGNRRIMKTLMKRR